MNFERISVIGLGYIGLPTAAMFASRKKQVIGVDVNPETVDIINQGKIHIVEPDLDILVHAAVTEGYLKATLKAEKADAFLIAVPTPFKPCEKGEIPEPDLSYIRTAAEAIAPVLEVGNLIILESTSPVGATEQLEAWLKELRPDLSCPSDGGNSDIYVAHCPERVLPGKVVRELIENDRVIGGISPECSEKAKELYEIFVKGSCIITNARTAEMAKLTENSFRDVNIAFANELSKICDGLDINVWELISLANRHPRVEILQPGPGVGGHCIAVDPWFIVSKSPEESKLIHTARLVNDSKPGWVIDKVKDQIKSLDSEDFKVACYGLAFKANIDDLRESPSLDICRELSSLYPGKVIAVEPNVEKVEGVELVSFESALKEADIHLMMVNHEEFYSIRPNRGHIIDTKGVWGEK